MYEELYKELHKYVKKNLNEHRYQHTMGVVETAERYAKRFGADADKARIAAVFHDACKSAGPLEHGPAAAEMLEKKFGVHDEDILNAIRFHTVGRANMSLLERVVKCADLTDPTRDYPTVDYYRNRLNSEEDLNPVLLDMMMENESLLKAKGQDMAQSSIECIEWLKQLLGNRRNMDNKDLVLFAAKFLDEKKALDISIIDISLKSGFADYFLLATAKSLRQIDALKNDLEDKLAEQGVLVKHIEGKGESGWVLMDYGDIIVNIFSEEQRNRYQIEKVWGDCDKLEFIPKED